MARIEEKGETVVISDVARPISKIYASRVIALSILLLNIFTLPSTRQHRPRRQPHGENASNHILVRQFNIKSAGPADASVLKTRDGFACGRAGKGQEGGVETRGSD